MTSSVFARRSRPGAARTFWPLRSPCVRRSRTSVRRSPPTSRRPAAALNALSNLHARFLSRAALVADPRACRWAWSLKDAPVEAALGPIALSAVKLITEGDFSRIKRCDGHACGWLFLDATKNNRRRWCEMEVCGNRAKQKRLAARRRGE